MDIYVTKRESVGKPFNGMVTEEFEDAGFDAGTELAYLETHEYTGEAAAERGAEAIPEFVEAQEGDGSELKLDGEINSVLQGIVQKFGGDPSDWRYTYAESGTQFFNAERLVDQDGISIADLIPEDRLAQYQELVETWKDNPYEIQHLEWWEKTDQGETIHVTALHLAEDGEVVSETWSHTIESGKGFEEFDGEIDGEIGMVLESNLGFITETFSDTMPEKLDLPRTEDIDPDPQILDLNVYLQESQPAQEISYNVDPSFDVLSIPAQTENDPPLVESLEIVAIHTAPGPEVNLVSDGAIIAEIPESEPIASAVPSGLQREAAAKERSAEAIAPAVDAPLDSNPASTIETRETVLDPRIYVPKILETVQEPEIAISTKPAAIEVNDPDITALDKSPELHSENVNEGAVILDPPLRRAAEERIDRGSMGESPEASPPKMTEQDITSEPISTTPEIADVRDSVREIILNADEVIPEKIALPRESVSQPTAPEFPLKGVRSVRVLEEKPAEITAVTVEFIPAMSVPDATISTKKLDSEIQVQKTEAQKEKPVKNITGTSFKFVGETRETKFQDPEIAVTYLTEATPDIREDEPMPVSVDDGASEDPATLRKIANKPESKKVESALSISPDRREILLRSFGLTSRQIRRYHGERQGSLRFAGMAGINNASAKAPGVILVRDRRNGISLVRYAA